MIRVSLPRSGLTKTSACRTRSSGSRPGRHSRWSLFARRSWLPTLALIALAGAGGAAQQGQPQDARRSTPVQAVDPGSAAPQRPQWVPLAEAIRGQGEEAQALPSIGGIVSVGLNVEISRLFADSGFIPPDTMAAVGPNHIVELINGNFEIRDKTTGASLDSRSLDSFWTNIVGLPIINNGRFDPRILFDPSSGRWFAVAIDNVIESVRGRGRSEDSQIMGLIRRREL
jgi:hypothetical protein